ncbi:glycosyltransferase [Roseovarius sp.]|uniref:glycosyltransferase n=1 Tax=Roseovarius sp. TaxID=1486281 RepID=UPI0026083543|nr:glycosyltransferase [Roseovarius sp.]
MNYFFIIPVFNAGAKIFRTIESVLSQTSIRSGDDTVECLIVDGASNDDTLHYVDAFKDQRISTISEKDAGMYDALAKGISRASGDITCYLPAGETYDENAFSIVSGVFNKFPEVNWLTGQAVLRNAERQIVNTRLPHPYRRRFITCGMYGTRLYGIEQESTFWRSDVNDCVDLEKLSSCQLAGDYFLWKSMASKHDLFVVDAQLGSFTIETGQLSKVQPGAYRKELRQLRRNPTWLERIEALLYRQYEKRAVPRYARNTVTFDHNKEDWKLWR